MHLPLKRSGCDAGQPNKRLRDYLIKGIFWGSQPHSCLKIHGKKDLHLWKKAISSPTAFFTGITRHTQVSLHFKTKAKDLNLTQLSSNLAATFHAFNSQMISLWVISSTSRPHHSPLRATSPRMTRAYIFHSCSCPQEKWTKTEQQIGAQLVKQSYTLAVWQLELTKKTCLWLQSFLLQLGPTPTFPRFCLKSSFNKIGYTKNWRTSNPSTP